MNMGFTPVDNNFRSVRVCIYARVSTEHEAQISALGNQIQYYQNIVNQHPDWILVEKYIDEGITGTSYKKRPAFLRMIEDAKAGKFDLILTREVSRFARNTVDTLVYTRELKKYGVEVYFTEDNIRTLEDEDGELRLTIMATLAQNESKKISERVKAGQKISFENGVFYGNGNILGYDRVGSKMIVNPEQAETVKMIFDLYEQGHGIRHIQYALEQAGRKTATGLTRWNFSAVNHVVTNCFYCGLIEYRKQFVPDYLEQHKINNHGEVERVIVEGTQEPIVTREQFEKCQRIHASRSKEVNGKNQGIKPPVSIWVKKMKCSCGGTWNRKVWHKNKNGVKQYAFQCYKQISTGTVRTRERKGLSTEGICTAPMIPQWKLDITASELVKALLGNKDRILEYANDTLQRCIDSSKVDEHIKNLDKLEREALKLRTKLSNLIDLFTGGDISKEIFRSKRDEIEKKIEIIKQKAEQETAIVNGLHDSGDQLESRIRFLQAELNNLMDFDVDNIPDYVIDALVQEVLVDGNRLIITLNGQKDVVETVLPEKKTGKKKENPCLDIAFYGKMIKNHTPSYPNTSSSSSLCCKQHRQRLPISRILR